VDSSKDFAVNGKLIVAIAAGSSKDVDIAVKAAKTVSYCSEVCPITSVQMLIRLLIIKAYKTSWGFKVSGVERGKMLNKLADLIERNTDEFAALESLDVGELFKDL
jgi:aldehyde dehydrogenase (NAD+)